MNIQKLKHNRTLMTVLQGLLLLVILSTLFSVCINLLLTGFSDDVIALNEQMADQQTVINDGHEQKAAERLEALSEATTELEKYKSETGSLKLLAVIMYAAFALLFLLKASITRDHWRLNLFRYGIGALLFAACAGIFLFTDSAKAYLPVTLLHVTALIADHDDPESEHDFGKNIIPMLLGQGKTLIPYRFEGYWKDVGTIDSYFEAHMDLLDKGLGTQLFLEGMPVFSNSNFYPAQYLGKKASVTNSIVSNGCSIKGSVTHSILGSGVQIGEGAVIEDAILLPGSRIGKNCRIKKAIINEGVHILPDSVIEDPDGQILVIGANSKFAG